MKQKRRPIVVDDYDAKLAALQKRFDDEIIEHRPTIDRLMAEVGKRGLDIQLNNQFVVSDVGHEAWGMKFVHKQISGEGWYLQGEDVSRVLSRFPTLKEVLTYLEEFLKDPSEQ